MNTIFSPIHSYVDNLDNNNNNDDNDDNINNNNNNNNNNDNNNDTFELSDLRDLYHLKFANNNIKRMINNFMSFKWKNSKYSNLLQLDLSSKNYKQFHNESIGSTICFDSLYVNKINNDNDTEEIKLIYITPHIIFANFVHGYSTADILNMKIIDVEKICVIPKFVFRSIQNKSVEFIDKKQHSTKSNRYVTLQSYLNYYNNHNYDLSNIETFLNNVFEVLIETNYIPYFVHPQRLILYADENIKILSPNLLQYIFSPYWNSKKIQHTLFSHPLVLKNINNHHNDANNNQTFLQEIINNTVDLFLDFFHSLFVTVLWIYNSNDNNNNNNNISSENVIRNAYNIFHSMTSAIMNRNNNNNLLGRGNNRNNSSSSNSSIRKKNIKINKNNFQLNCFMNLYNNNDNHLKYNSNNNNNDISLCKNTSGFCLIYEKEYELRNLIHNYGCDHLQLTMPLVLNNAITRAHNHNQPEIFMSSIKLEFDIFANFLYQLKNIEKNHNDS